MTIAKNLNGNSLTLHLAGRLDTTTAPELESVVDSSLAGVQELILDLEALEYISSAGLRVILKARKMMLAHRQKSSCFRCWVVERRRGFCGGTSCRKCNNPL